MSRPIEPGCSIVIATILNHTHDGAVKLEDAVMTDYWKKHYDLSVQKDNDKLFLSKRTDTDWSHITMLTNGNENGEIVLRSKEHAEALRFMLGQMLEIGG